MAPMAGTEIVVMLHGLGRTRLSLVKAMRSLRRAGFRPVLLGYPSRRQGIPELAETVAARLPGRAEEPLHFVTHSMGGILLRWLRDRCRLDRVGRVVMLGPPNQGSQLAQRLRENRLLRLALGPALLQLGTDESSIPLALGPANFELGVIAGNRPLNPLSRLIRGENDGMVAVEETRVEGMADFLVVHRGHTFIMNDEGVLRQTAEFLRRGRFQRTETG
jgi:pimeloyl-ACP methyl ester carboxylesterase